MISNACLPNWPSSAWGEGVTTVPYPPYPRTELRQEARWQSWGCQLGEAGGGPLLPRKRTDKGSRGQNHRGLGEGLRTTWFEEKGF